jgi:hypothetical protein
MKATQYPAAWRSAALVFLMAREVGQGTVTEHYRICALPITGARDNIPIPYPPTFVKLLINSGTQMPRSARLFGAKRVNCGRFWTATPAAIGFVANTVPAPGVVGGISSIMTLSPAAAAAIAAILVYLGYGIEEKDVIQIFDPLGCHRRYRALLPRVNRDPPAWIAYSFTGTGSQNWSCVMIRNRTGLIEPLTLIWGDAYVIAPF